WWERSQAGQPPLDFESVAITPFDTAAENLPDAVVVADFTGDGLDDVLYRVSYYDPGDYRPIFLRVASLDAAGKGSFGPEIQVNPPGHDFAAVDLTRSRPADIDGDGKTDLFAAIDPFLDPSAPFVEAGYTTFSWNDAAGQFELHGDFFAGDPSLDV